MDLYYRCDFCNKPYTNYMSLRNHMRIHGQKRYMCDLCGKAFRLARYLRNHQRIHDDGPNRFDCPSCCKSYRTMLELAQHRCTVAASSQVCYRVVSALLCLRLHSVSCGWLMIKGQSWEWTNDVCHQQTQNRWNDGSASSSALGGVMWWSLCRYCPLSSSFMSYNAQLESVEQKDG